MNIGNYTFDGPYDPDKGFNRDFGAVYAIIDGLLNLIDAGQTDSVNNRIPNHDRKDMWPRHAQQGYSLYVLVEENENVRLQIEAQIRNQYQPPCGDR